MLCELRVKNLALIKSLELQFPTDRNGSLVVMTGETGAGKSVMLRAIHLLSGKRASAEWVRSGEDSCEVEALFECNPQHSDLHARLQQGGFAEENETLIIRRILNANGRSRFYLNGSLATAKLISEIAVELVNVASQHDQQQLLHTSVHLDLLDTIGESWPMRTNVQKNYRTWRSKKEELDSLQTREQEKAQRQDFLTFQAKEIRDADLQPQEDEELTAEKKRLKNGRTLIELTKASCFMLTGELGNGLTQLRQNVTQLASLDESAAKMAEVISDYTFQAEDLTAELKQYQGTLEADPYRLEQVNERLDLLSRLKRKYGETIDDILNFADEAEAELTQLENMDQEIARMREEVERLSEDLFGHCSALHAARQKSAASLAKAMDKELASLSFTSPRFMVQFSEIPSDREAALALVGDTGWDSVEFFFSANLGEEPKPLAKIASGGELSRLLLALKCILAQKDMVDTVIFDEVDTGIGGEAAEAVARKIQELAGHHQVFCITHLPQIAARGTLHLQVAKSVIAKRTRTSVGVLTENERVQEIVRMLAGDSGSEQTEAWAKELLQKSGANQR